MPSSILDVITHYQRSIEKSSHDEARLLHCIEKLYKLPVTVEHLQSTGVGKTVNSLRKYNGEVGIAAKTLVAKWKAMVAAEEKDAQSDEEIRKAPYYDDDRENGNSSNKNSTTIEEKMGESSSLLENRHNSNISNHSSSSHHKSHKINNLEGQNHVMKRKHDNNDNLSKKDEYSSSGSGKKHHKKIKKECDTNELRDSRDSTSYEKTSRNRSDVNGDKSLNANNYETQEILSDFKPHIKQEKLESLEDDDDDQSSTGYDDEAEKLVIDVKPKIEEDTDDNADDTEKEITESRKDHNSLKSKESSKRKSNDHKDSSRSSSRHSKKESSSSKSKRESNDRHNSDKHKSASHHHQKSKHYDEKKSKDKDDETNNSSSSHHRSKSEKESRNKDRGNDTDNKKHKEKDKNKSKTDGSRSTSKSHRHHDSNILSSGSDEKYTKKITHNADSNSNSPSKVKVKKQLDEGIDSSMGTSFEEALGMLNTPTSSFSSTTSKSLSKTKTKSTTSSDGGGLEDNFIKPSSRNSSSTDKSSTPELLSSSVKLVPLDLNINLDLPTISPNYKPMPLNPTVMDCVFNNRQFQRKMLSDEEALAAGISSKTIRTKVYSGVKTGQLQQVPTLFDLCIWVLQKNIDALEYTGGVPYDVLKPVLELATPMQLANFEEYNPYLMEDTDHLWEKICQRHCKGVKRQEMESWREMYMRCQEEREVRLSKLTENIKQSQKQITLPVKKTQLAYMDSMVKPPRSVLRKQEQFGTSHRKVTTPAARVASLSGLAPNIAKAPENKVRIIPGERDTAQANAHTRPKKAPLMQKTLQLMKDDDEFIPSQRLKITKSEYSLRNGIKEGIDIIPDCNKQIRNNEKRRLWERRCLGLGLDLESNLSR